MKPSSADIERRVREILDDPAQADTQLGTTLRDLWALYKKHLQRTDRIVHLSDAYQAMALDHQRTAAERSRKQLRRLGRILLISDRYQAMLREANARLDSISYHDGLTGIPNRRALDEILERAAVHVEEGQPSFVLAMLDVDYFKQVNDAHGHETGDRVLVELANVLAKDIRGHDVCGRWGGEEFLMILPQTTLSAATSLVARKAEQVRNLNMIAPNGQPIAVTISAGLAQHVVGDPPNQTLRRADAALYLAKRQGRNRVALSETPETRCSSA